jgi:hypothetical protein
MNDDQFAVQALPPGEAASRAGQKYALGDVLKVYVQYSKSPLTRPGLGFAALSLWFFLAAAGFTSWLLLHVAVALFAAGCVLFAAGRVMNVVARLKKKVTGWVARYRDGFVQVSAPGVQHVVRWMDVTEIGVTYRLTSTGGNQFVAPTIRTIVSSFSAQSAVTQLKFLISEKQLRHGLLAELAGDAVRSAGPRMTATYIASYGASESAIFGQIRISQSGITLPASPGRRGWPAGLVPWSEISAINGRFLPNQRNVCDQIILRFTGSRRLRTVGLSNVPNGIFLPAVLQHAAAQQGIRIQIRV